MALPRAPVPGFNYGQDPTKGGWTKKFVREALPDLKTDPKLIDELFTAASDLVASGHLIMEAYKGTANPKMALSRDRQQAASDLERQFGLRIMVQQHPGFAARLCKGIITYMGGSGKRLDPSAIPQTPTPSTASSQPSFTPQTPTRSVPPSRLMASSREQSLARESPTPAFALASLSDTSRSLNDFVFHVSSYRMSKETPTLRLRVSQIWGDLPSDAEANSLTIEPLFAKLRTGRLLVDETSQFVVYDHEGESVCIEVAEDLHQAVWEARAKLRTALRLQITGAKDHA